MKVTKEFVVAGKAIFTVETDPEYARKNDLKPHYTFRVKFSKGKPKAGRPNEMWPDTYFVGILTGPENTKDYSYLGMLDKDTGKVRCTVKSYLPQDHLVTLLLNRTLALIWAGDTKPIEDAGFKLHHEGRCGRCARLLTVPESIESGIGPECAGRVAGSRKSRVKVVREAETVEDEPEQPSRDASEQPVFWGGGRWLGQSM